MILIVDRQKGVGAGMGGKKLRRMSKSAAVYIPVGAIMIILLTIFGTSGFMRVIDIEVVGVSKYTAGDVIEASGISPGDNLLFINKGDAGSRIKTSMPYIYEATIIRLPPDSIRIEVAESTALATIAYQFETLVIDASGRVLQRSGEAPEGLFEIRGFAPGEVTEGSALRAQQGDETKLGFLMAVVEAIEREGMQGGVSYLDITNFSNITFGYLERYRVILGSANNLRQKLATLPGAIAAIEEMESPGVTGTFRFEDGGEWRWNKDN